MIYVLTVHHLTNKWCEIQTYHIRKNLPDARIISIVDDNSMMKYFDSALLYNVQMEKDSKTTLKNKNLGVITQTSQHSLLLDYLFDTLIATDNDIIIFLDNDAFPFDKSCQQLLDKVMSVGSVGDEVTRVGDKMSSYPLVSVQRLENNNDTFPHPCFTITTYGFWKTHKLTWSLAWPTYYRKRTDVGTYLHYYLEKNNIIWFPILRTLTHNYHPILFGIYESIYHHGAGSRKAQTHLDLDTDRLIVQKNVERNTKNSQMIYDLLSSEGISSVIQQLTRN